MNKKHCDFRQAN